MKVEREKSTNKKNVDPVKVINKENFMEVLRSNIENFLHNNPTVKAADLARRAGVSQGTISNIQKGVTKDVSTAIYTSINEAVYSRVAVDEIEKK